jgi:glycosyltransferase involved in cell wall biosynthesis
MKILQINNCHYRRGGADVVYLNTGKLLEKKGQQVFYFSQKNKKNEDCSTEEYFVDSIDFINSSLFEKVFLVPRFFYSKKAENKLKRLILNIKPDIAHIHIYKGTLTPSILKILKRYSIPTIISLHDYGFLCPHNLMLDGNFNICTRCITGSSINCVIHKCNRNSRVHSLISALEFQYHKIFFPFEKYFDNIIAVSKFGQNIHNSSGKFKKNILHLYNFYPELYEVSPNSIKGNYFLFFGRLSEEKGIKSLIKAWMLKKRKSILKIVGTGKMYEELVSLYQNETSIQILGFKQGEELNSLIRNSSFVIIPSEWYENNPLTIIESYANGKPVIGSRIGGIPEIIVDGETGFLFEMRNINDLSDKISIAEELSNEDYKMFSINARKFAELHFDPDEHYKKLINIYTETINKCNNEGK